MRQGGRLRQVALLHLAVLSIGVGTVLEVGVNGAEGYWAEGLTQLTILADPSAGWDGSTTRPSANMLIWQENGVAYRMESALSMQEALEITRSMQPVDE